MLAPASQRSLDAVPCVQLADYWHDSLIQSPDAGAWPSCRASLRDPGGVSATRPHRFTQMHRLPDDTPITQGLMILLRRYLQVPAAEGIEQPETELAPVACVLADLLCLNEMTIPDDLAVRLLASLALS